MRTTTCAKIKISPHPKIIRTLKIYSKCLKVCVDAAWENKIKNAFKLQPFVYQNLRDAGLQAQLAITCIRQACGMVKKAKTKPTINNVSMRYNFPRSASMKNNLLSLSTVDGRVKIPFVVPECYKEYFSWDVSESLLRIDKKGRCFFIFTFSKEVNAAALNSCSQTFVLGIDLGVNNLAVTSDGRFFRSSKTKQIKRKYKYLRSKLQAKGTKPAKRLLKKMSGKERRFMADTNHCVSKAIINGCGATKIVMEDLKGIRKKNRGKRMNYWISNWSYYQLQFFIQYKAERQGIEVIRVKPNYTSKICHRCGELGSRKTQGNFFCSHCGLSYNADLNAARNLAHPNLGERQGAIKRPNAVCDEAEGTYLSAIEAEHNCKPTTSVVGI